MLGGCAEAAGGMRWRACAPCWGDDLLLDGPCTPDAPSQLTAGGEQSVSPCHSSLRVGLGPEILS